MLHIQQIDFSYNKSKKIFDQLDLSIEKGHIYGLLGQNGAGKSTLFKICNGILYPNSGDVKLNEISVQKRLPDTLKDIYMIPEEFYLPEDFGSKQYIKHFSVFYPNFDHVMCENLLKRFNLDHVNKLKSYSYGMKKMFIICFSLSTNCNLILMDEPTNGLDIPSKSIFRKVISESINDERSIVISTHQVRDLENLIDPIIIIKNGKIIFNYSMDTISSKLRFEKADKTTLNPDEVLYSEDVFGGTYALLKNHDNSFSQVDIELLFNAILANNSGISEFLNQ